MASTSFLLLPKPKGEIRILSPECLLQTWSFVPGDNKGGVLRDHALGDVVPKSDPTPAGSKEYSHSLLPLTFQKQAEHLEKRDKAPSSTLHPADLVGFFHFDPSRSLPWVGILSTFPGIWRPKSPSLIAGYTEARQKLGTQTSAVVPLESVQTLSEHPSGSHEIKEGTGCQAQP